MESWLCPSEWRPASIPGAFPKPPSPCQMHAEGSTGPWQFHTRVYQQRHRFYTAVGQLLQFSEPLYLPIKQIKPISQGCNKVKMQLTCNVPTMISRALQAFNKYRFVELIWKMRWSTVRTNTFKLILWANKILQHLYVTTREWKCLKEILFL